MKHETKTQLREEAMEAEIEQLQYHNDILRRNIDVLEGNLINMVDERSELVRRWRVARDDQFAAESKLRVIKLVAGMTIILTAIVLAILYV